MTATRLINRANLLGIILSGLGLVAFASWFNIPGSLPGTYATQGPSLWAELPFLEDWWNGGQGKGFRFLDRELPPTSESRAVDELISGATLPGYWSTGEISELSHFILEKSEEYGVSPFLLLSLIDVESGFRPGAVSRRGAVGLMQLLPDTAEEVALHSGLIWHPGLLKDPKSNIELGLRYMAQLKKQFGSEENALTAYNIGPTALRAKLSLGEDVSLKYFHRVTSQMQNFRRLARISQARSRLWARPWL